MATRLAVGQAVGPLAVASAEHYVPTGVLLEIGGTYDISSDDSRWLDWHLAASADGRVEPTLTQSMAQWALRCKEGRWFQLIGALGRSDAHLFPVGMHLRWTYKGQSNEVEPELQLFANDAWFAYFNNHGSVGVTIRRVS